MKVFAVIPTYNEAKNLEELIKQIFTLQPEFNLIIVDDSSPDGTGDIADELAKQDSRINVVHRSEKMGLGTAYVRGFKEALAKGADLIFEIDADFSHDPKYLEDFLEAAKKYDLVIGSRYVDGVRVEGWKFRRLLLSKFANMYVSYIMVRPVWDFTAGYRCYRRKVLETIDLDSIKSDGYAFQIEMIYLTFKNKFSVHEIPIIFKERKHGYSKISRKVVREAFWITLRFRAPITKIIKHLSYFFKDYDEFVSNSSQNSDE
ncbi:MAG: polyprenol monophosphomannose synthase [Candidatus Omnitrophota bacterium]